jgi:hemerythrin-like domain-containing protein
METTPADVSHRFLLDHKRLEVLLVQLLAAFTANDHEAESRLWQECSSGLRSHLEAEETHLIPALRRLSERDARVVVQEHQHIRTRLAEIGAGIDSRSVRTETVRDFIDELRAHAQSEDRLLYRWADSHLDEQELASAVGALVTV